METSSLRIVDKIPQKITTSQEPAAFTEIGNLMLLSGSEGAPSWRPVLYGPFEWPVWLFRKQGWMDAMCIFLQGQNPSLLVHDTKKLLQELVTLKSLARTDDDQFRPSTSKRDV